MSCLFGCRGIAFRRLRSIFVLLGILSSRGASAYTATVDGYEWTYFLDGADGGARISKVSPSPSGFVTIPSAFGKHQVTTIGDGAFLRMSGLRTITLPEGVTAIGERAFIECGSLQNVTMPDSVTSIGQRAFESCVNLSSVSIPDGVANIEWGTFYGCSNLTSVVFPADLTTIGGSAFAYCSSLASVVVPDKVASIGPMAFYGCSSLSSVSIPDNVARIEFGTFNHCSSLENVTLQNCLTTIYDSSTSNPPFPDHTSVSTVHTRTCTVEGQTAEVVCSRCGVVLETFPGIPAGHSGAVAKPAVEPTSVLEGKTAEIVCTRCGEVLQKQETIPPLGYVRNAAMERIVDKSALGDLPVADIMEKAKRHDGIVISGFYMGMSISDAKRIAEHLGLSGWKYENWNEYYDVYFIGGSAYLGPNEIWIRVLKRSGRVNCINFGRSVIKKLIGKTQPVSKDRLGRQFFLHFDLDGTTDYYGDIKMETPEDEYIKYRCDETEIWWESNDLGLRP